MQDKQDISLGKTQKQSRKLAPQNHFLRFLWSCLSDSRSKSCNTACCKKSKLVPENVISVTLSVFLTK